jgi:hypothetical protein
MMRAVGVLQSLFVCCCVLLSPLHAQDDSSYTEGHEWLTFGVGAWRLVRLHTETIGPDGTVGATSVEDSRSTLVEVNDTDYVLKVESTVEAGGTRIENKPQYLHRGYRGETKGQKATVRKLGPVDLEVANRRIPTQLLEIVLTSKEQRRVRKVHYTPAVAPSLLRQQLAATDAGSRKIFDAISEVIAFDMPWKVGSELKPAAFVHTVLRLSTGESTITVEVRCADVPGAIVAHSAKSLDRSGRLIQRTTLELLDYAAPTHASIRPVVDQRRAFLRGRHRRP